MLPILILILILIFIPSRLRRQFVLKYGKAFHEDARNNTNGIVNDRVVHKLSIQPPSSFLVVSYLREIAAEYGVNYDPDVAETSTFTPISAPTGFSVPVAPGSEFRQVYAEEGTAASASLPQGWTTSQDGLLSVKNSDASGNGAIPPPPQRLPVASSVEAAATRSEPAVEQRENDIVVPPSLDGLAAEAREEDEAGGGGGEGGGGGGKETEGRREQSEVGQAKRNAAPAADEAKVDYDSLAARFASLKR